MHKQLPQTFSHGSSLSFFFFGDFVNIVEGFATLQTHTTFTTHSRKLIRMDNERELLIVPHYILYKNQYKYQN